MPPKRRPTRRSNKRPQPAVNSSPTAPFERVKPKETDFEAKVLPGLEPFALTELKSVKGVQQVREEPGAIAFLYVGDAVKLSNLRTVVSVYQVLTFAVPRPKALLGHEHLSRLTEEIKKLTARETFEGFRLSAAGDDSAVFKRLGEELAKMTGLAQDAEGDLLVRVRRAQNAVQGRQTGWEVLLRLTPRPLSARAWRVCNLPGGLNAALGAVMVGLAEVRPNERVFNPMCGSGTLLAEVGLQRSSAQLTGCDLVPAALACSAENVTAAGFTAEIFEADATATGLGDGSVNVIVSDPPWGDAVGTHKQNAALYPAFLAECARIAAPGARFVLLTHEVKLLERLLETSEWQLETQFKVFHGGHYPRVYLLRKP